MEENKNNEIPEQPLESTEAPVEGTVFKEKESKVGPMIGSIIVIIIIIVGGLYFWGNYINQIKTENNIEQQDSPASEAEEIEQIENELENLNFDDIDAELDAIDTEFDTL